MHFKGWDGYLIYSKLTGLSSWDKHDYAKSSSSPNVATGIRSNLAAYFSY